VPWRGSEADLACAHTGPRHASPHVSHGPRRPPAVVDRELVARRRRRRSAAGAARRAWWLRVQLCGWPGSPRMVIATGTSGFFHERPW